MSNPWALPDASSYFISANKSLADIDNTKAITAYHQEQANVLKTKTAENEALKEAAKADAANAPSPFTLSNDPSMPGVNGNGGAGNMSVLGQAPAFPKMFQMAADADTKYRKYMAISPTAAKEYLKQRDELFSKASDDQRLWTERVTKNIDKVNEALGGITGAPTYNATMKALIAEQGPGIIKKLGLPESITQAQYETDPTIADTVQAIRQRGYTLRDELATKHQDAVLEQTKAHQAALEEDARLRRAQTDTQNALHRDDIKLRREERDAANKEKKAASQNQLIEKAVDNLDKDETFKDFPKYQQGVKQVKGIFEKLVDPKTGDLPEDWWDKMPLADQQVIKKTYQDMKSQFKDRASAVMDNKEYESLGGWFQSIEKTVKTLGTGKAAAGPRDTLEVGQTINFMASVNNASVAKRELETLGTLKKQGVDAEGRMPLRADYKDLIKSGFAAIVLKDGKPVTDDAGAVLVQFKNDPKRYYAIPKGQL